MSAPRTVTLLAVIEIDERPGRSEHKVADYLTAAIEDWCGQGAIRFATVQSGVSAAAVRAGADHFDNVRSPEFEAVAARYVEAVKRVADVDAAERALLAFADDEALPMVWRAIVHDVEALRHEAERADGAQRGLPVAIRSAIADTIDAWVKAERLSLAGRLEAALYIESEAARAA